MSFYAELLLAGQRFPVRSFSWEVSQDTDELGRPEALVQGGTLDLVLDSPPSEVLESWALDNTKTLDGQLLVFEADRAFVRDTLRFFDAHCVRFSKQFQDAHSVAGMTMHVALSANKLQFAELEVNNQWPGVASST